MRLEPLALPGVHLLVPEPIRDERGFFARIFDRAQLEAAGLATDFPQWSIAYNLRRGTLRGMHWQKKPHGEAKIVQCVRGVIFDVIVDIRHASPCFGRWLGVELSAANHTALYIPDGFAHGFATLSDETEVYYHISVPFMPESARGLRWNDPQIGIAWPVTEPLIISARDRTLPALNDIERDDG